MSRDRIQLPGGKSITFAKASGLVDEYLKKNRAAFELYDCTNEGPHDEVSPLDLLSLNALNAFAGTSPMTVMDLLWQRKAKVSEAIKHVTMEDVRFLSEAQRAREVDHLVSSIEVVMGFKQWGDTRASKLIHRLRPNIAPIWDTLVGKWYSDHKGWPEFITAVHGDVLGDNQPMLENLERKHGILPLRPWDIILWKEGQSLK